jgi:hypothetical protein
MNWQVFWGVLALGAAAGCGGRTLVELERDGESFDECERVSACGGEIVGDWRVIGACTDVSFVKDALLGCEEVAIVDSESEVSGGIHYAAAGEYSLAVTYWGTLILGVPSSCFERRASNDPCRDMGRILEQRGELFLDSASCSPAGDGCACELSREPFQWIRSGSYTTDGSVVRDSAGQQSQYCVTDDRLWLSLDASESGDVIVFARD